MKLDQIKTLEALKLAKHAFFGKNSEFRKLQSALRTALPHEKAKLGQQIQALKVAAEAAFSAKSNEIKALQIATQVAEEWLDVSVPTNQNGSLHPLTLVTQRITEWFSQNGYCELFGSEIESDLYNFERLNIAPNHPARDMQDSLYITKNQLLRTHNTGLTARFLEAHANQTGAAFAIGKVYRHDEDDATHSHQFTQLDFVAVGDLSLPNLIWTLKSLLSYVFEETIQMRLRPSYFPFTEPSIEIDLWFENRWVEILGAGMLNQTVLKLAGYTNQMNGFAGGVGIERLAMIKYGVSDIREFYKNDQRFLNQFQGAQ